MPFDLVFSYSEKEVVERLGDPDIVKEAKKHKFFGQFYPWIKYKIDDFFMRVEFSLDKDKIRMIALSVD